MAIYLEKINNLYTDRYTVTLNVIRKIHKMIDKGEHHPIIAEGKKLASYMLNQIFDEQK